jgi:DNA-binding transcriptional regulator/RsmH inhibitor MraZ
MSDQFQQYKGTYPYKTDSKNRVNVVAGWRPQAGENLYMMASFDKKSELPIIKVMTDEGIASRLKVVDEYVSDPGERAEIKSELKSNLRDANLNDQGRLLIPKDYANHAGIEPDADVYLVAGDSHFEIWSKENYATARGGLGVAPARNKLGIF